MREEKLLSVGVAEELQPEEARQCAQESVQPSDQAAEAVECPYYKRYYLKYREGKRTAALDLEGTSAFLQSIGFDGGELRKARKGKNCAEDYRSADRNKDSRMSCSYCGSAIAGVEYSRLPDGRMRCTTCSGSVVKTKAEAEELLRRVAANMDRFFGAAIDVPVSVEIVEERKVKKRLGGLLGTADSRSALILGAAIAKKGAYRIVLENGAPRISLVATFAHELTHIWQYSHWDSNKNLKKCAPNKRLLIYEGMAKWAEIQYLYLAGETNAAKREEYAAKNRRDEYGVGFCLYEDRFPLSRAVMSCEYTPFTPDRYPFDD